MSIRRSFGVTLPELLVVIGIIAIVAIATTTIFLRVTGVYARTSAHTNPQSAEMLALKRIENDLREAMFVSIVTPTPATWVEISLPQVDSNGVPLIVKGTDGSIGLTRNPALDTSYFLGDLVYPTFGDKSHWNAIPDPNGHTIFRALSSTKTSAGIFPNAMVIIDGVLSTPMVPDPQHPGREIPGRLFEYWPSDPNDPTRPSVDSQLVRVTLTIPVQSNTGSSVLIENHTVQTQFCLRNWNSSQAQ